MKQKRIASTHHFKNAGVPTPEAKPFVWNDNQRVKDVPSLQAALRASADKLRKAENEEPPASPFSALKGRLPDEGDLVFNADITFNSPYHAILILDEVAAHLGANVTASDYGPDNTWSLRVGRTITTIDADGLITLRANFLAPSLQDLREWLGEYAPWAFDTGRNPKREPVPQTAEQRTANTYRFCCSLKCNPRDMRATLLTIYNHTAFRDSASDRDGSGEWSYSRSMPSLKPIATPAPQFFNWGEDARFQTKSDLITALEQAAQEVAAAKIDSETGYGAFGALDKLATGGAYCFRAHNIQFGNRQIAAESMRQIAREIGAGETQGTVGMHRWSLTMGEPEQFEAPAPSDSPAPAPEKQTEPVLPAVAPAETQSPETAEIQPGAS